MPIKYPVFRISEMNSAHTPMKKKNYDLKYTLTSAILYQISLLNDNQTPLIDE